MLGLVMSKVVYLNSHLEKFREQTEIKIELDDLRSLAHYSNINSEDKKTTKIFIECFKNKETYKDLLNKIPKNVDNLGRYYLITVYWIAYINYYKNEKFSEEMNRMLEGIDEYTILIDSPHFCKKVYYYLNQIKLVN